MPQSAVYGIGLIPALWTVFNAVDDRLGADPVRALEHAFGLWSLRLLIASLAITPLRHIGGPDFTTLRRPFGLLAFCYAILHVIVYAVLDRDTDVGAIIKDIAYRPYVTVGTIAFLMLVPLAVTSSNSMMRRLGWRAWKGLHKLAYPAAALAALHFVLLKKTWSLEPVVYACIVSALLFARLGQQWLRRYRPTDARSAARPERRRRTLV